MGFYSLVKKRFTRSSCPSLYLWLFPYVSVLVTPQVVTPVSIAGSSKPWNSVQDFPVILDHSLALTLRSTFGFHFSSH